MAVGAYHRLAHHRITPQSNKPPILAAVYMYSRRAASSAIRTETRLGKRASYDARAACFSLTCTASNTSVRTGRSCLLRVFACAAPTCISRQTWGGSCSGASPAALCCNTPCSHAPSLLSPSLSSTRSTRPVIRLKHTHTHTKKSASTLWVQQEYNRMYVSKGGLQQLHISREVMQQYNTSRAFVNKYFRVSTI